MERMKVFNTHQIFYGISFIGALILFVGGISTDEILAIIIFAVLSLMMLFLILISPLHYMFCDESVEIVYNFGRREIIKWRSVKSISLVGKWIGSGHLPYYEIAYGKESKRPFYMRSEISKTRKTTKLIKKYYKKDIR